MSVFDDIKGKAADLVHGNEAAIRDGIQRSAEDFVGRLGGSHSGTSEGDAAAGQPSADERA